MEPLDAEALGIEPNSYLLNDWIGIHFGHKMSTTSWTQIPVDFPTNDESHSVCRAISF